MSGLEEVGIPGPENLRESLTNCTDPLSAIEEFQVYFQFYSFSCIIAQYIDLIMSMSESRHKSGFLETV